MGGGGVGCGFFFFQAEDGIRDTSVTGVQTCALPISTMQEMKLSCETPISIDVPAKYKQMSTEI